MKDISDKTISCDETALSTIHFHIFKWKNRSGLNFSNNALNSILEYISESIFRILIIYYEAILESVCYNTAYLRNRPVHGL